MCASYLSTHSHNILLKDILNSAAKLRKVYAEDLNHDSDYLNTSPRRQYLQQQCHEIGEPWQEFPIQRGLDRSSPSPAHRRQRLASAAGNSVSWSGRSGGRLLPPTPKQPSTLNIDTLQTTGYFMNSGWCHTTLPRVDMLKNTLWLAFKNNVTWNSQSECFISMQHSYSTQSATGPWWWFGGQCGVVSPRRSEFEPHVNDRYDRNWP